MSSDLPVVSSVVDLSSTRGGVVVAVVDLVSTRGRVVIADVELRGGCLKKYQNSWVSFCELFTTFTDLIFRENVIFGVFEFRTFFEKAAG